MRWLYNTQFSSGELCDASAPLSLYACVCVQAMLVYCVCVCVFACCGELLSESAGALSRCTKWGPGPVSEQRMMTDLLVRLFCHTHTCHNLPRLDCAALALCRCRRRLALCAFFVAFALFVFRLFLRNVVVFARFVRLKFIWLWPKGDGL